MATPEPAQEEPTIGKLVVDALDDAGSLFRHFVELAKAELKVSVRFGFGAVALFVLAGFIALLSVVMVSFAFAFFIAMAGLDIAWGFLIVFGAYLLLAGILGFVGYVLVRKVKAPQHTIAQAQKMSEIKPG